jgi:hypothetical protein
MSRLKVKIIKENPDFELGSVHEFKASVAQSLINSGYAELVTVDTVEQKPKQTRKPKAK